MSCSTRWSRSGLYRRGGPIEVSIRIGEGSGRLSSFAALPSCFGQMWKLFSGWVPRDPVVSDCFDGGAETGDVTGHPA